MNIDFDSLWDYGDAAASEARFLALLPDVADRLEERLELLTQIARARGLQRRFDEAHRTLDDVERALDGAPLRPRVRYLLERGRLHNSAGNPEVAQPWFAEAWRLAAAAPEEAFYAVDAAHMLAIVSPPDEALVWNLQALALAGASADARTRRWEGSLLNNIGWAYHAAGDFPAALTYLERALTFRRQHGPPEQARIARWCVARVRRDLGQVAEALAEQQALRAEYEALGTPSGYVYEEIAECLALLGDQADARPYFARAYALLAQDAWLTAEEPERVERLRRLGGSE